MAFLSIHNSLINQKKIKNILSERKCTNDVTEKRMTYGKQYVSYI